MSSNNYAVLYRRAGRREVGCSGETMIMSLIHHNIVKDEPVDAQNP